MVLEWEIAETREPLSERESSSSLSSLSSSSSSCSGTAGGGALPLALRLLDGAPLLLDGLDSLFLKNIIDWNKHPEHENWGCSRIKCYFHFRSRGLEVRLRDSCSYSDEDVGYMS